MLGELSRAEFLRDHWQQRPLLVRQAFPGLTSPVTAEELAGLACEPEVESRIVIEEGGVRPWEVRWGPFEEGSFTGLPDERWTLLVHGLDRLLPDVARLLDRFRFIPNWRIDDVMASYAAPGGSVGPHLDRYDVFLIQAEGRRNWQIGNEPLADETLREVEDLRILREFEPDSEWVLDAGDMLYLPPCFPHHGIAVEPCITLSVGFHAPQQREMIGALAHHIGDSLDDDPGWTDVATNPADEPGLISVETLEHVRGIVQGALSDPERLDRWFGRFVTEPRRPPDRNLPEHPLRDEDLLDRLREGARLERTAVPCFSHTRDARGQVTLFVGGDDYRLGEHLASLGPMLTGRDVLDRDTLEPWLEDPGVIGLLARLVNAGFLLVEP